MCGYIRTHTHPANGPASAGLTFHPTEGGSRANRSITERKRERESDWSGGEGRWYGCRRTAAAAERHDVIEERSDRQKHTQIFNACSSRACRAEVDGSAGRQGGSWTHSAAYRLETNSLDSLSPDVCRGWVWPGVYFPWVWSYITSLSVYICVTYYLYESVCCHFCLSTCEHFLFRWFFEKVNETLSLIYHEHYQRDGGRVKENRKAELKWDENRGMGTRWEGGYPITSNDKIIVISLSQHWVWLTAACIALAAVYMCVEKICTSESERKDTSAHTRWCCY